MKVPQLLYLPEEPGPYHCCTGGSVRWLSGLMCTHFGHSVVLRTRAVGEALEWYRKIECVHCFVQMYHNHSGNGVEGIVSAAAVKKKMKSLGSWAAEAVRKFEESAPAGRSIAALQGTGPVPRVMPASEVPLLAERVRMYFGSESALRYVLRPYLQSYGYRQVLEALMDKAGIEICHSWVATECCATLL